MQNILVIGGGFAGLNAALNAADQVGQNGGDIAVTLVSNSKYITMRPRLYEVNPEALREPLRPIFDAAGIDFKIGNADSIDSSQRTVSLQGGETFTYDRLVLTAGSQLKPLPVSGIAEHGFNIDSYDAAVAFDAHLARLAGAEETPGADTFVIVGAGITGIELALEMHTRIASHGGSAAAQRARIVLVERDDVLGLEMGDNPRPVIEKALAEAGVEIHLGSEVSEAAADHLVLSNGARIDTASIIVTSGMVASPIGATVGVDVDEQGRLPVDEMLRTQGSPEIFAAGDMARAYVDDSNLAVMSCQHAGTMGKYAGHNAARDLMGLETRAYRQPNYVTCMDLGAYGAVFTTGWDRVVEASGPEVNARKRMINEQLIYPPEATSREEILAARRIDENGR
ncbi:MAG: FAD-dependent oxidoreductase [Rhodospirillaceae bacterium]|jgi:NADH dehydrogenase|nr:FAD-dependent oxidoreductase [Rhodospirillaceae bacterium]MBT3887491.1 FAD-dependent oxidoreductase [Rhodospirillaceae bacterium]MBT4118315.1 FAD-dependent oxidoreductase [Rhodospirillaceae bacterium]MBT4674569.1 FAD-dependent oxidoreductase [Rhodospirillaceae bacterium]MBT4720799.1 FAD-dependent oxidoreductase [Rhodospirillaceae bacterium]